MGLLHRCWQRLRTRRQVIRSPTILPFSWTEGGITIATSVVVLVGIGDQETFELLQILRFTFYGLAYRNPEAAAKRNDHPGRMPHSLRASNGMAKRAK